MTRVGIVSAAFLALVLCGGTAPGYAGQEQQGDRHRKPDQQAESEKRGGRPQTQVRKGQPQPVQRQQGADQARPVPPQAAQPQAVRPPAPAMQGDRRPPAPRTMEQRRAQMAQQRSVWAGRRATRWEAEHRTWQQRGGYNGYHVPDRYFRTYYGPAHWFRVYGLPFMVVDGFPRFRYGRYWFSFVDPYPEYWGDGWYENDDVYVDYADGGYYLFNRRYPGRPGVAISIVF